MNIENLTTITDAAAEVGIPRTTFQRKLREYDIEPTRRVRHSSTGRGFTPAEMDRIRSIFGVRKMATAS